MKLDYKYSCIVIVVLVYKHMRFKCELIKLLAYLLSYLLNRFSAVCHKYCTAACI